MLEDLSLALAVIVAVTFMGALCGMFAYVICKRFEIDDASQKRDTLAVSKRRRQGTRPEPSEPFIEIH